jgi:hypothetical protein
LAFDNDAILIGVKKIIVEENAPNGMHKLLAAMSENTLLLCIPSGVEGSQYILKRIRKRGNIGNMITGLR